VDEAVALLEYANVPGGTTRSDERLANGSAAPFDIRMWCLGNEMDGPWQLGHKTADEYGRVAAETARAMRMLDPGLELVACGSSGGWMPTFIEWERTVLEHAYELVDYVSLHAYFEEGEAGDLASFLASASVCVAACIMKPPSEPIPIMRNPSASAGRICSTVVRKIPAVFPAASAAATTRSIAVRKRGSSNCRKSPIEYERSEGPTNSTSMPSVAAISSTASTASGDSICATPSVRSRARPIGSGSVAKRAPR